MPKKFSMRRALPILVAAVLLTAILVDVVAASVKTVTRGSRVSYPAPEAGITVTVPNSMKAFPAELLPQ
jgi:P pilus assembly chaperone PapD